MARDPQNPRILDLYAEFLLEVGRDDDARRALQMGIDLSPDTNPMKYMSMGQFLTGIDALRCFSKGVEMMSSAMGEGDDDLRQKLSSGLCSMAELYMTDLCDDPGAEANCESLLARAIEVASDNVDAHRSLASLRMIQERHDEATASVDRCLELFDDDDDRALFDSQLEVAKLCIELGRFGDALDLVDRCLCIDDNSAELFVLAALCHLKEDDIDDGLGYADRARELLGKDPNPALQVELDAIQLELRRRNSKSSNAI